MIRTLLKEVKEYKAASIATPFFMILEVLFETLIPFLWHLLSIRVSIPEIFTIFTKLVEL